jgi:hypothetical protein
MVKSLTPILVGALLIGSARADLQLTPKRSQYESDGVKTEILAFSDGGSKTISYSPPRGWDYSGSTSRLTLQPLGKSQALATITKTSQPQPGKFDDESMKKLTADVLASVPGGSTNVTVVSQEKNVFLIGQKETFLVVVSYTLNSENYERSMMFLNRGNEQVRFQFVSRAADFKDLHRAFQSSLFTWKNL